TKCVMYFNSVMLFMAATIFALRARSTSILTFMHRSLGIAPPGKRQGVPAGLLDRPRRKASLGNVNSELRGTDGSCNAAWAHAGLGKCSVEWIQTWFSTRCKRNPRRAVI